MLLLQQITIVIKMEKHIYVLKDNTFINLRPVSSQGLPQSNSTLKSNPKYIFHEQRKKIDKFNVAIIKQISIVKQSDQNYT